MILLNITAQSQFWTTQGVDETSYTIILENNIVCITIRIVV